MARKGTAQPNEGFTKDTNGKQIPYLDKTLLGVDLNEDGQIAERLSIDKLPNHTFAPLRAGDFANRGLWLYFDADLLESKLENRIKAQRLEIEDKRSEAEIAALDESDPRRLMFDMQRKQRKMIIDAINKGMTREALEASGINCDCLD